MTPTGIIRTYAQTNKWHLQTSFSAYGLSIDYVQVIHALIVYHAVHCLVHTSRKVRLQRASLLHHPHDGASTTATRHQSGQELHFPLALVADRLIVPILSLVTYLIGMCVPNPSLPMRSMRKDCRGQSLLFCSTLALHVAGFVQQLQRFNRWTSEGISHHGWQHTNWLWYPRKMATFRYTG